MKSTFLSRFTPSSMAAETLEAIFVQRQALAEYLVDIIRVSATTANKHFQLLVGMRGIGKTHLISLIYHRVSKMDDLRDKLLIGWLREEEWGVDSFLALLQRIFRALQKEYPTEYDAKLNKRVEALYQLSPDEAEYEAAASLREFVGSRTLLLLIENLDALFDGLGDIGQKQLRAYIQNYSFLTILATSQSLFNSVKLQTYPFYGFFGTHHLDKLTLDEAICLLTQIAKLESEELVSFIQSPTGQSRIKAIHHLAGGNHRVYVIFAEFLSRKSLDELVEPFMRTLDELTPYYQARMQWISPQQRKIVDFLCDRRSAVTVKEIAQRCFMTQQTASGQLKKLLEMSYVRSEPIGRESFYELREVLMRFCLDVKKQRGEPIRLFVDFLRLWYSQQELQERLERLSSMELQAAPLEIEYLHYALKQTSHHDPLADEDPRVAAYWEEYWAYYNRNDWLPALSIAEKLVAFRGSTDDWFQEGCCLAALQRYEEAIAFYDKAIEIKPDYHYAWNNRGIALFDLGQMEEAIASYDKAIEFKPDYHYAWNNRGNALFDLGRIEEAIASWDKAIEIKPDFHYAWYNRGNALFDLGRMEEAIASYDKAIEIKPDFHEAWYNRGVALRNLGRMEEAIASYDKAIEIKPDFHEAWYNRGIALVNLGRMEEAIASWDKAIEIKPDKHEAWYNRGVALDDLGQMEEAIASWDKAIEIKPDKHEAWYNRGVALDDLGQMEEAIASFDKAIEFKPDKHEAWFNRGVALENLGRIEEVIASYDKAIEFKPDDYEAWNNRGIALFNLSRMEEAIASYDKAIEFKPDLHYAWFNRGYALYKLGRYDEALASYDKAIELGYPSSHVFFNRAIALLGLNRWDEGSAELENAFHRLSQEPENQADAEDAELILRHQFDSTKNAEVWKTRLSTLIAVYDKYEAAPILGKALVQTIPALMSEMVGNKAARTWLKVWQELASEMRDFQIPLRLLNAAVRYRETKGDRRVLLELAIEERKLLEKVLEIEPS